MAWQVATGLPLPLVLAEVRVRGPFFRASLILALQQNNDPGLLQKSQVKVRSSQTFILLWNNFLYVFQRLILRVAREEGLENNNKRENIQIKLCVACCSDSPFNAKSGPLRGGRNMLPCPLSVIRC